MHTHMHKPHTLANAHAHTKTQKCRGHGVPIGLSGVSNYSVDRHKQVYHLYYFYNFILFLLLLLLLS
jgi:hypothetical protein